MGLVLAACSSDSEPDDPAPSATGVALRQVASFDQPVAMATRGGEIFVAEQAGRVRALDGGDVLLDITDRVQSGGEEGLLGIAFKDNDLYAYWTDEDGNNGVYVYADADKAHERKLLTLNHPNYGNHNGGNIAFGPDGGLYVGTGDGGGGGDPDRNGQNQGTVLGKILRISVDADAAQDGIDNLVTTDFWHYGLRNPWRFSFDRETDELWIADVGQGEWEEINKVAGDAKGVNFGWNLREGTHEFAGAKPAGAVDPVYEYNHDGGNCTVVGGYVYRGAAIPSLKGAYLFADYCVGDLKKLVGGNASDLGLHVDNPSSFGQDADGELYVLSLGGAVYKLVPSEG